MGLDQLKDNTVVVKKVYQHNIVVKHRDEKTEEVDIVKEDTMENSLDLEDSTFEMKVEEEVD